MKELSQNLLDNQKASSSWKPCVKLMVDDRHIGVPRLLWESLYEGTEEAFFNAICASGSNVLRARVTTNGSLYVCRTHYNATSGWGNWGSALETGISAYAQVALAADGAGKVWLFFVDGDERTLKCRKSTDGGQSFAAAETVYTAPSGHRIRSLAAACETGPHEVVALFSDDAGGGEPDDTIRASWYNSGWQSAPWPRSAGDAAQGLAAISSGSNSAAAKIYFFLCGKFEDTSRPSVRLYYLQITSSGYCSWFYVGLPLLSDMLSWGWAWPSIARSQGDRPRLFLAEDDGAEKRTAHLFVHDFVGTQDHTFGDLVPYDYTISTYGIAPSLTVCQGYYFLANAPRVWRAPVYTGSEAQRAELSASLLAYDFRDEPRRASRSIFILRNDDGRFNQAGQEGDTYQALRLGAQVSLREGYITASGEEVAYQAPRWIERIAYTAAPRDMADLLPRSAGFASLPGAVILFCYDPWAVLWETPAARSYFWQTDPKVVLRQAFGKFGFVYSDDGSPSLTVSGTAPVFALDTGRPWGELISRVLDYTGCEVKFYVDETEEESWPSARAYVFTPNDSSVYSYGGQGEHLIIAAEYGQDDQRGGRFQVFGDGQFAESFDFEEISDLGFCRTLKTYEPRYTGAEDVTVQDRASFEKERARWRSFSGQIAVPNNVGQELFDVVTISDDRAGLSGAPRRILGIRKRYDSRKSLYLAYLNLGGV